MFNHFHHSTQPLYFTLICSQMLPSLPLDSTLYFTLLCCSRKLLMFNHFYHLPQPPTLIFFALLLFPFTRLSDASQVYSFLPINATQLLYFTLTCPQMTNYLHYLVFPSNQPKFTILLCPEKLCYFTLLHIPTWILYFSLACQILLFEILAHQLASCVPVIPIIMHPMCTLCVSFVYPMCTLFLPFAYLCAAHGLCTCLIPSGQAAIVNSCCSHHAPEMLYCVLRGLGSWIGNLFKASSGS